jgi:hypothetical protein
MSRSKPLVPYCSLAAGAALLAAAGCAALPGRGASGPYLAPGPLPAITGASRGVSPALPDRRGAAAQQAAPASLVPAGLVAADGMGRLPGARLPGVGPVQAMVVPVSLGGKAPVRDGAALVREVFGGDGGGGATLAGALLEASGGKFRLTAVPLPALVDRRPAAALSDVSRLRALAEASMRSWSRQVDLASLDNDGPDGVAGSPDDDGAVDLLLLAVEADQPLPSLTIRDGVKVPARTRSGLLDSGPIHVLGLGRDGGDALTPAIGLVLDGLGLDAGERFFPAGFPRLISTLARVRLGWVPLRVAEAGALPERVPPGEALLISLRDMPGGSGFWLVENDGRWTFASRVVRTGEGRYAPTDVRVWEPGKPLVLPLSRQLGELGERVVVGGSAAPTLEWVGGRSGVTAPEPAAAARW